jgi:SAM-dependent methyltransferase
MTERYRFDYDEDSVYGHAVRLITASAAKDGLVLDIGCGYGAIAEPVTAAGLHYVGLDLEEGGLADLSGRGFETHPLDLRDVSNLSTRLSEILGGRRVGAFVALDVIEHLLEGPEVLRILRSLAEETSPTSLVVSIPNVTHVDLAAKALIGRWDVTPMGLLDETHVSLYSSTRLETVLGDSGWIETARDDFVLVESDQHFPAISAPLRSGSPLHDFIAALRSRAQPGATVNQFVRSYRPGAMREPSIIGPVEPGSVFLSVIVPSAKASLEMLEDCLVSLDGQSIQNFELIVVTHNESESRVRDLVGAFSGGLAARTTFCDGTDLPRAGALNRAIERACGYYVSVVDPDVVLFGNWIETFGSLSENALGAVLRAIPATQQARHLPWPNAAHLKGHEATGAPSTPDMPVPSLIDVLTDDVMPASSVAIPRSCFVDLGLSYDASLGDAGEWLLAAEASLLCGLECSASNVTAMRRITGAPLERDESASLVREALDRGPVLLPAGTVQLLAELKRRAGGSAHAGDGQGDESAVPVADDHALREEIARLEREVSALRSSTSWRVTGPLRELARMWRASQARSSSPSLKP